MGERAEKKPPSKQEIRRRLERQTRSFLNGGGEIESVPLGVSAVDEAISPIKTPIFSGKPQTRTPVTDVIETLRRRREANYAENQSLCESESPLDVSR